MKKLSAALLLTIAAIGASPAVAQEMYPYHYDTIPQADAIRNRLSEFGDSLKTRTTLDLGIQASYYNFRQTDLSFNPDINDNIGGPKLGMSFGWTFKFLRDYFGTLDTRGTLGYVTHTSNGLDSDNIDWFAEPRFYVGRDFVFDRSLTVQPFSVSPIIGLGYRFLSDHVSGEYKPVDAVYTRDSSWTYLILGVQPRVALSPYEHITMHLEYDLLLNGKTDYNFSDLSKSFLDAKFDQSSGFGIKANIMHETKRWSLGPYFNYWNIDTSSIDAIYKSAQPANSSYEFGAQAIVHFGL